MKQKRRISIFTALITCVLIAGCSGQDAAPAGASSSAPSASPSQEQTADASDEAPATRTDASENAADPDAPVIESTDLTRFRFDFADPEGADKADDSGQIADALNQSSFHLTLASSDITDPSSPVSCQISHRPYTEPADADYGTVSFDADASDLAALQALIEENSMISSYCNFDDELDADTDHAYANMSFEYASGESAWHYCNTACDVTAPDRLAVLSFFYGLLEKYNVRYYYHPVDFAEETDFIEAFLGQTAWDDLTVTGKEGEETRLTLTSDATGRVFHLEAGENTYAGNYKLKKREDDGRWRVDLTLTTWPADYEKMTKGGSILIDTEVGSGSETLVITKYPNQASLFDPFYGEDGALSFTRTRSEYFDEKPFATEQGDAEETPST